MGIAKYAVLTLLLWVARGSRKKGGAIAPRAYQCDDLKVLNNMAWWYDWGGNFEFIEGESTCELDAYVRKYVPMLWGYRPSWYQNFYVEEGTDFILGFNEPNHIEQANLTPQMAVEGWPLVEAFANGRPIVSPAAAFCGSGVTKCHTETATEWFDEFFTLLCVNESTTPCRVSYLATHIYPWNCNVNKAMRELEELYDRYHLKIWLTEFSCPYVTDPQDQLTFMEKILPRLEAADYVYRYSWFVHRSSVDSTFITDSANLFEKDSSTLTTLGEYYNGYTGPDPEPEGVCVRRNTRR